jgi:nitrous oxidase accessory protein NosD
VAKKVRKTGTGSADTTVTPSGSGRLIYQQEGNAIVVYSPSRVEGADTIYTEIGREPSASGTSYTAVRHGD